MPTIYRSMFHTSGQPLVGSGRNQLGVRVPPQSPADVHPDAQGIISSGGGMSVSRHWNKLPGRLIPERLHTICPKARGDDSLRCFRHGQGEFCDGTVAAGLVLRVTSGVHGQVEPDAEVSVQAFQAALAATRDDWMVDEEASGS